MFGWIFWHFIHMGVSGPSLLVESTDSMILVLWHVQIFYIAIIRTIWTNTHFTVLFYPNSTYNLTIAYTCTNTCNWYYTRFVHIQVQVYYYNDWKSSWWAIYSWSCDQTHCTVITILTDISISSPSSSTPKLWYLICI